MEAALHPGSDLEQIVARAHAVAGAVLGPLAEEVDADARWVAEGIAALQEAGLGGLVVPRRWGGLDQGLSALARVCETLGRQCASTAICFGMHCVGAGVIAAKATPEQGERFLEPIAAGAHLTTLSLSEPGTGSHFYLPQTRLTQPSPEVLRLDGRKSFVTNGSHADSYVVSTVAAGEDAPPDAFSLVLVPGDADGIAWSDAWHGLGMRGNDSRTLELSGVEVPRANLLGQHGDEIWYVFNVVAPYFLVAMAGTYLGVASAAVDEARIHLRTRRYSMSGAPLASQPVLQHRLGQLWTQVERTRRLVYHAADEADTGGAEALLALCAAKADVAECAVAVANEALTLTGGTAYRENSRLARALRDARAAHVMAPTTDVVLTWAGRALLELPLLSD